MRGQAIAEPGLATNPAMMAREGAGLCLPSVPERAAGKVSSRLGTLRPTWRGASGDRFPEPLFCTRWPPMSWAGWGRLGAQIGDKGQPVSQAQRGVTMFRKRGPRNTALLRAVALMAGWDLQLCPGGSAMSGAGSSHRGTANGRVIGLATGGRAPDRTGRPMRTPGLGAGKRGRGICLCDLQKVTGSCPGGPRYCVLFQLRGADRPRPAPHPSGQSELCLSVCPSPLCPPCWATGTHLWARPGTRD